MKTKMQCSKQTAFFATLALSAVLLFTYRNLSMHFFKNIQDFTFSTVTSRNQVHHNKWIVVSMETASLEDILFLSSIPDWKVAVVADEIPTAVSLPTNCQYLTPATTKDLGLDTQELLLNGTTSRKTIGYLYAIGQGAEIIYDSDGLRPTDLLSNFYLTSRLTSGLMYAGDGPFNPFTHFGQPSLQPRGFPQGAKHGHQTTSYRLSTQWSTPAIQCAMVNGNAGMAASLTPGKQQVRLNLTFDPVAPPVLLPEGVFSPFTSDNTMFHYRAMWALLEPNVKVGMSDVIRGYWAQRLLWEIGGRLAFFPPNSRYNASGNSTEKLKERVSSLDFDVNKFLGLLSNWVCPSTYRFFQCVQKLSDDIAVQGFVQKDFSKFTADWLANLISLGYKEPFRIGNMPDLKSMRLHTVQQGSPVEFVAAEQYSPDNTENKQTSSLVSQVTAMCPKGLLKNVQSPIDISPKHIHNDLLLIIVFNFNGLYSNIQYLELIYRNIFPNIIYCGSSRENFLSTTAKLNRLFSFIEAPIHKGWYGYRCMTRALQMSYGVTGHFLIADDIVLSSWQLAQLDKNNIWEIPNLHFDCTVGRPGWLWWPLKCGKEALMAAFSKVRTLVHTPETGALDPDVFFNNVKNGTRFECSVAAGDIFYVPKRFAVNVEFYLRLFSSFNSFQELAVPTVLTGVANRSDITVLTGKYLWGDERNKPWHTYYSPENLLFIHAVKYSNKNLVPQLCQWYLKELLSRISS